MTRFNIQFDYNNTLHHATVIKITLSNNLPVQYIIFDVDTEIENGPPVFVYGPEKHTPRTTTCNEPDEIIKALKDYCVENYIQLTSQQCSI